MNLEYLAWMRGKIYNGCGCPILYTYIDQTFIQIRFFSMEVLLLLKLIECDNIYWTFKYRDAKHYNIHMLEFLE